MSFFDYYVVRIGSLWIVHSIFLFLDCIIHNAYEVHVGILVLYVWFLGGYY